MMGDTLQDAINALRAAGLSDEAEAVEELRAHLKSTMDDYHAGQRASYQDGAKDAADEIKRLRAEVGEFKDAARVNLENYEFQRLKADRATATVYQFHYAMKDAGWHPGRTDDNLCDIIRAKGKELAAAESNMGYYRNFAAEVLTVKRLPVPQDMEAMCRRAYDNRYHKVKADMSYDDWRMVWIKAVAAHESDPQYSAPQTVPTQRQNAGQNAD